MEGGQVREREIRILLLEDNATDAELELRELRRAGLRISARVVQDEAAFRLELREFRPDIIVSDFSMPGFDGMFALDIARELAPETPFVFVSGTIGEEYAIRAIKRGATDYVLKNNLVRLPVAVERAIGEARERAARRRVERELEETRSRLESIVSALPDVVWSVAPDPCRLLYISPSFAKLWGPLEERMQRDPWAWLDVVHPEDRLQAQSAWHGALAGAPLDSVYRVVRPDGQTRWIHNRGQAVRDAAGRIVRVDGVARDITLLKHQEERIVRLNRVLSVLSGINSTIVRIRDRRRLFEEVCRIVVEEGKFGMVWIGLVDAERQRVEPVAWRGFSEETARAVNWASVSGAQGTLAEALRSRRPAVRNDIEKELAVDELRREALEKGCRSTVCLPLVAGGRVGALVALFAERRGFFDREELALFEEVASDLSFALDYIAKEEQLDYLAYYDALTGLPNRRLFHDRLGQRIAAARDEKQSFSVMVLDLERFRLVNDTLGRQAGDELLREVARRLKEALHAADLLAHFEGDCFAIATQRSGETEAVVHALEQVLSAVSCAPFGTHGTEVRLAARAGVAVYPVDGGEAQALVERAETALNDARKAGQRYVFYAPQMNARVAGRLRLENELRRAVEGQQFILHYQPRFDLSSGRITGLEALIRWRHPERGLVPPGEFIAVLEDTGLILEAGRWAIERAALDHAAWSAAGLAPPRVAVNVSPIQLRHRDFIAQVREALAAMAGAGERLDLEITESMLMEDIEGAIAKLGELRAMGLQIALDDFGTGYSSLSYLTRLPLHSLKVDRSFVARMSKGPEEMAVVSTVISLARALNLKVVAEGVETEEQANLLKLLRCDEAQGYFFAKPMPEQEIARLLARA
ncbi:MAG TPA: EAL domain-containing protein [Burkholderiales bacterium]|nr:EAL domain-containing protein [Burkholderiales bacterium]